MEREPQEQDDGRQTSGRGCLRVVFVAVGVLCLLVSLGVGRYGMQFFPDAANFVREFPGMFSLSISIRSEPSHVKADLRSMATAIESYYVDNNAYPAASPMCLHTSDSKRLKALGGWSVNTLAPATLTTPIAYMITMPMDLFTGPLKRRFYYRGMIDGPHHDPGVVPFAYEPVGDGWLMWSPGYDGDYDITRAAAVYDPAGRVPSADLVNLTYDPTNGSRSNGDIYRVKQ